MPVITQSKPPIFLGGAGRSGTTLLRVILDSHPNIACGPEVKVIPALANMWHQFHTAFFQTLQSYHLTKGDINQLFSNVMLTLFEKYRRSQGKPRIAEKSPNNVFFFQHLHCLFPDSPLVHVIRDGRDVVCSLLTMDWVDAVSHKPLDYIQDAGKAAKYWSDAVRAGRQMLAEESKRKRYTEIRYEDIVINPEKALKELFTFLEEPWDPVVLRYHEQKRDLAGESSASMVSLPLYNSALGRWQRDLKSEDKDAVKAVAGDLLIELNYASDNDW